jgi:hypothetical protein
MTISRCTLAIGTLAITAAAAMAGCGGGPAATPTTTSASPNTAAVQAAVHMPSWFREAPASIAKGVYVGEQLAHSVFGYFPRNDRENNGPACTLSPGASPVDLASDRQGNVIVAEQGGFYGVEVYSGASMCGASLGTSSDDSFPQSAASRDAATGLIYIANLEGPQGQHGTVSVCTLAAGCTGTLSTPVLFGESSITVDAHGNVYVSGDVTPSGTAALVVFKHGTGAGHVITAYENASPGALDVDRDGNLTAIDPYVRGVGQLYVYSGCPDHCLAHGPWFLKGLSQSGKVTRKGDHYYAADYANGTIDVYAYKGTDGIKYAYSISKGLSQDQQVSGVAVTPSTP